MEIDGIIKGLGVVLFILLAIFIILGGKEGWDE